MTFPNGNLQALVKAEEKRVSAILKKPPTTDSQKPKNGKGKTELKIIEGVGRVDDLEIRLKKTIRRDE